MLIQSGTRPVSRERLARELYGDSDRVDSNALEVHIHNLRKLIGRERIETVRGFGYRLATS
jgi:DNA-binding response OmpR family regulator